MILIKQKSIGKRTTNGRSLTQISHALTYKHRPEMNCDIWITEGTTNMSHEHNTLAIPKGMSLASWAIQGADVSALNDTAIPDLSRAPAHALAGQQKVMK